MKASKDTAHYRDQPNGSEQCASCTMFRPANGCSAVEGNISPRGWCSYYEGVGAALRKAERQVERNPSEAQKEAGNYSKGKLTAHGLPITIENPQGSKREGVDKGGKPWSVTLPAAYGYIRGTLGRDGDAVDVYLGRDHTSQKAFIVDQVDAKTKKPDEHKVLLSYPNKSAALSDYKAAFSDGKGADRIGGVKETTVAKFREWLGLGDTTKPAARQAFADGGRVGLASGGYYWGNHPEWTRLSGIERAAAMALLEADRRDFDSAKNALGAMLNRAHREKKDLGEHVSGRIYQPTIEPAQFARLRSVLGSPEHKRLMELAERRMSGAEPDWVQGATHFLAPESQMLRLSAGVRPNPRGQGYVGNSGKYYSWPQWTQYDPAFGYRNVVMRDKSHAFVAPEGRYSAAYGDKPAAVAEAPSGGWQWPALSGSIAFGGLPSRAELEPPMAAGLRDVPPTPIPVERPVVPMSAAPAFDARSFFDTLDRSSYASGGKTMPLIKSGSKAAIGKNIAEMQASGHSRSQSLAAALDTARRYGKGKAYGGPVGYAEGGAPWGGEMDSPRLPAMLETAERLRSPVPDWLLAQQQTQRTEREARSAEPGPVDFSRIPALDVAAEMTGIPAISRGVNRMGEEGLGNKIAGFGEVASGVLPGLGMTRAAAPLFSTIPRTLGTISAPQALQQFFTPAEAAELAKADPGAQLRKSLDQLQVQRAKQQDIADKAKERQDANRPANRAPNEKTDKKFFEAKREYDDAMAELKRLGPEIKETEERLGAATKAGEQAAGRERLKEVQGEWTAKGAVEAAMPWLALPLGAAAGYYGGKGIGLLTNKLDANRVGTADKFLAGNLTKKPLADRIGNLNRFWSEGSKGVSGEFGTPPFSHAASAPFWKANKKGVAPSHELFPPRSRAGDYMANAGLTGVYGAEAALGYKWGEDAHKELKEASAALQADTNEATIQRYEKAKTDVAIVDTMLRFGLTAGLGQGVKGSTAVYGSPSLRPNVGRADSERAKLSEMLSTKRAKAKADKAKQEGGGGKGRGSRKEPPKTPNGAAALLPLSLPPLAALTQEPESSLSLPDATLPLSDEPPYAKGGEVKHWSHYQPRDRLRRFKGGPIYPNKASLTKRKGNEDRTEGGEFKRGGLVSRALDIARRYASGGRVLVGPVVGATGGRSDKLPVDVPAGSYVVPADVVSALGEGNSLAGGEKLKKMFGKPGTHKGDKVAIRISHGEYVITPEQVANLGHGDLDQGHRILDALMKRIRAEHVKTLSNLPPPAQS